MLQHWLVQNLPECWLIHDLMENSVLHSALRRPRTWLKVCENLVYTFLTVQMYNFPVFVVWNKKKCYILEDSHHFTIFVCFMFTYLQTILHYVYPIVNMRTMYIIILFLSKNLRNSFVSKRKNSHERRAQWLGFFKSIKKWESSVTKSWSLSKLLDCSHEQYQTPSYLHQTYQIHWKYFCRAHAWVELR